MIGTQQCALHRTTTVQIIRTLLRRCTPGFASVAIAAFPPSLASTPAYAQGNSPDAALMVLFDSSGSMWGKLAGNPQPKFALARRALRDQLASTAANRPSGLIIFGRSCAAAALSAPIRKRSADDLFAPINSLNPSGKGPLGLAIQNAASSLPPKTSGDVVVVHDGPDNCGQDVCAITRDIKQSHPGLRFHLLSIGLSNQDLRATRCIADISGGTVTTADDPIAMLSAANDLSAALDTGATPRATARQRGNTTPPATPDAARETRRRQALETGPSRIVLAATVGPAGPRITQAIRWRIWPADADTKAAEALIDTAKAELTQRLPAGNYTVRGTIQGLTATVDVTVPTKGAASQSLAFNAGRVEIKTASEPVFKSAILTLTPQATAADTATSPDKGQAQSGGRILNSQAQDPLLLPTGTYWLQAQFGQTENIQAITVEPGSDTTLDPFAGHGVLELKIKGQTGQLTQTPISLKIESDAPNRPSGRRLEALSTSTNTLHVLRAGTYYVTVKIGARATTQQVAVPAGKTIQRAFTLQAATLRPTIRLGPENNVALRRGTPLSFAVYDMLSPTATEVAWTSSPNPTFHLPPGRYRIIARIGAHNAKSEQTIAVTAAETRNLAMNVQAAEIKLMLEGDNTGRATDRLWEVRTTGGDVVWRTNHQAPTALLAPGRYVVRCLMKSRILEGNFSVENGTAQTVALIAN